MSQSPSLCRTRLNQTTPSGITSLVSLYICWGLFPLYWKNFAAISPLEVLFHRTCWGMVALLPMLCLTSAGREFLRGCRERRNLIVICLCSIAHMINWALHIWASSHDKVLELSLGMYILPLLSVLAGALFFRERPRPLQWTAIGLATCGVIIMTTHYGVFPWLALATAASAAVFSILRKLAPISAVPGLFLEFLFATPLLVGYMIWLAHTGQSAMGQGDLRMDLLLVGAGILTSLSQVVYAFGLHRICMTTLGFLQYIMPTVTFFIGIFIFHEAVTNTRIGAFACIWIGLVLYTLDARRYRKHLK